MDVAIVTAVITAILGPILLIVIKHILSKKKGDMVAEALETSERVMHKLDHIKQEYGADRLWVSQFHNGGHFYPTGKSIAKFSIVYECVSVDTISKQMHFKNIPVGLFGKFINYLLAEDVITIPDYKDETIATHGLKYIAEQDETKSSYLFAIKNLDGKFIGILGVEFTKRKTQLPNEDVAHLATYAAAIGGVLNTHLNKS